MARMCAGQYLRDSRDADDMACEPLLGGGASVVLGGRYSLPTSGLVTAIVPMVVSIPELAPERGRANKAELEFDLGLDGGA
eukprot:CAMPEP_0177519838 /NCGR_PEP_ID=MMETSP0369-20130122/47317_1 /TAXON_ID=447022 ORGANISM="Scrippsiella hangoei-like, Strain SHHI-4" /NCGR_SAMPLE_ID=MMETSP0369 /ASSEMBLY_ACC=CAM_ASM_000364 /LENGTH=80 /DNA_ID=CAMNT_0018999129 /DNA_START=117 /DNA_END=355 /DNA_ORIENTATION=-